MRRSPGPEILGRLDRYPASSRPIDEPESLGGAGGYSGARLWRYRSGQGPLVLRLWPPHGPGRDHLERVHRWLRAAGDLGFIPAPIADRSGRTLQESEAGFWELAPWMPGAPDVARPPTPIHLRSAFAAMAAFHLRLDGERVLGTSPGLGHRQATVAHLLGGGFDALERSIRPATDATGPMALRWLERARAAAPRLIGPLRRAAGRVAPLQPCLRDARPEHFLFEGDRVTGLVDFGAMGVDCVAGDLARLLGEWAVVAPPDRAVALAAYGRIRPIDPDEAALIDAFAASSALLIGERWIRWHHVEHRRFDDPSAVARGIARGLAALERWADRAP
jgi:homoserine kinase type II